MMRRKESRLVGWLKPLSIALLLFMIFTIVWLRSSVVSLEYTLSRLEKKGAELAGDRKTLLAERSNLLYVGRLENSSADGGGFSFPDRVKVVYVKKAKDREARKVALTAGANDKQEAR
jgi:hypothetical protein